MGKSALYQLFCLVDQFIPNSIAERKEVPVALNWLSAGWACRAQETQFDLTYSTAHKYWHLGLKAIMLALHNNMSTSAQVPVAFAEKHPYFDRAICVIDGVYFLLSVPASTVERFRNRKGWVSMNVLIASDWEMKLSFVFVGAEESAHDANVLLWSDVLSKIPDNSYAVA